MNCSSPTISPAVLREAALFTDGLITTSVLQEVAAMNGLPLHIDAPALADPTIQAIAQRALSTVEAGLRDAQRVYDFARKAIGEANATGTKAVVQNGRTIAAARRFAPERIRERKSAAFTLFNQRRGQLAKAKRLVAAARAALGLPALLQPAVFKAVGTVACRTIMPQIAPDAPQRAVSI